MATLFIGPAGSEPIGMTPDGNLIVANEDGVGAMVEVPGITVDLPRFSA